MANKTPLKANFTGSDVTSLGEFASGDTIAISYIADGTLTAAKMAADVATQAELDTVSGVASAALPKAGGTLTGGIAGTTASFSGMTTAEGGITCNGQVIFNEDSADLNFRVEGNGDANLFFVDGGTDRVGIGIGAPTEKLDITSSGHVKAIAKTTSSNGIGGFEAWGNDDTYLKIFQFGNAYGGTTFGGLTGNDQAVVEAQNVTSLVFTTQGGSSPPIVFAPARTEKMRIASNGVTTFQNSVTAGTDTDTSNSGSITLDFATNQNFVLTLTGNVTLANPTTETVGQSGFIAFIQDGTGSRTVSLGTDYETAAAAGLTLTATASATDLVPYLVVASNRILLGTPQLAFA